MNASATIINVPAILNGIATMPISKTRQKKTIPKISSIINSPDFTGNRPMFPVEQVEKSSLVHFEGRTCCLPVF